jgi:hypothetical protein|tara:strand:- start:46 stop:378 length:333 start_codon:yes stop_codon:yes gene_type:complete
MVDNRVAEKLHGVISQLTDEYNNYHNKRIKKADVRNLINDLEVVDAELHELISPHNNNTVCMFYVITELKDIVTEKDDEQKMIMVTEFYNTLVFNLGVNTLNNHNNDWEE